VLHSIVSLEIERHNTKSSPTLRFPFPPRLGPPLGALLQSIDLAVQEHLPATSSETPAQISSYAPSKTYALTLLLTILSPIACFQAFTLVTMTPFSHPDLRHLEADALSEQSRVLAYLAYDLQYTASILSHKASDLESHSTAVRKSIWEDVDDVPGGTTMSKEEQDRIKQFIKNMSKFMEVAFETKHGLKQVIETACTNYGYGGPDNNHDPAPTDSLDGTTDVAAPAFTESFLAAPSLENQIDRELTQA
jgi:hypothetical protein